MVDYQDAFKCILDEEVGAYATRALQLLTHVRVVEKLQQAYVQKNRFDPRVPLPYPRSATLTLLSGPSSWLSMPSTC